jgi:hypothetical protein
MQLMKRLFQFVVFALVLLAAAQPLLADTVCTEQRCGGTPDCSLHLGGMSIPDSAMSSLLASSRQLAPSPGTSYSKSSEFKFLPAISARMTALGLTGPKGMLCTQI